MNSQQLCISRRLMFLSWGIKVSLRKYILNKSCEAHQYMYDNHIRSASVVTM